MIYVFNPISGSPTEGTPFTGEVLPYNVLQVTMMNQMDDHFLHPLLLLDKDFKVMESPTVKYKNLKQSHLTGILGC